VVPAFPFGFGLSYTSFELGDASVLLGDEVVTINVNIANTGSRDGADVVQVYAALPDDDAPPRLVGFARVEVPAGGQHAVTIEVPTERLATRDPAAHQWRSARGVHRFAVSRFAGDPDSISLKVELS
jgi:beta-glucosidase